MEVEKNYLAGDEKTRLAVEAMGIGHARVLPILQA